MDSPDGMKSLLLSQEKQSDLSCQEKFQQSLDNQDAKQFIANIKAVTNSNGSPFDFGVSKITEFKVESEGEQVTLLDYVLKWESPLNENQKQICSSLFGALGEHILDGAIAADPLARACQSNKKDTVALLIPIYTQNQKNAIDNSPSVAVYNRKKNDQDIEHIDSSNFADMAARLLAAVDVTTSLEILDIIESAGNPETSAMTPEFKKIKTSSMTPGTTTHGSLFHEQIKTQREKIKSSTNQTLNLNNDKKPTYFKEGAIIGGAIGIGLIGLLIGTSFLADYLSHVYTSENSKSAPFNADKMFNKLAEWMWCGVLGNEHNNATHFHNQHTPLGGMLAFGGTMVSLICATMGASAGNKKLKV